MFFFVSYWYIISGTTYSGVSWFVSSAVQRSSLSGPPSLSEIFPLVSDGSLVFLEKQMITGEDAQLRVDIFFAWWILDEHFN